MPLFNPYDEEERKRRLLTPGINPNAAPVLPDLPPPSRPTLSPPSIPPGGYGAPSYHPEDIAPPGRYQQLEAEKQGYLRGTPGRGKSALTGALEGFAGGGGLLGAITGAAEGAIAPRRLREQQFNARVKPQILERFGYEDQAAAGQRQAAEDALNSEYRQAQIGELQSQAYKNRLPPPAPRPVNTPRGALNPVTNTIIPGTEPLPRTERPAYRDIRDPDGKVRTYQIVPGQPPIPVGESGAAAISQANIRSHEGIAARHEAGENSRAVQRQEGANTRAAARPKPGSKGPATKEDIEEAFRRAGGHAAGYTLKGMKKHFKDQGFSVPE